MRHIAITEFSGEICHGQIVHEPIPTEPNSPRFRLPIYPAQTATSKPLARWRCLGCNQIWEHEPLPQEAL